MRHITVVSVGTVGVSMEWFGCLCGMVWSSMIGYAVAQYVILWHGVLCGTLKRKLHGARRVRLLVQPSQVMTA